MCSIVECDLLLLLHFRVILVGGSIHFRVILVGGSSESDLKECLTYGLFEFGNQYNAKCASLFLLAQRTLVSKKGECEKAFLSQVRGGPDTNQKPNSNSFSLSAFEIREEHRLYQHSSVALISLLSDQAYHEVLVLNCQ
jgi:hypothetical protein